MGGIIVYSGRSIACEVDEDWALKDRIVRGHTILQKEDSNKGTYYYIHNAHGDITALTNERGEVVNSYSYDAFGNILDSTEKVDNRFKYSGELHDPVTGQYYLRARYYNPSIGRFMQEDTFRGDGLNLYTYVANNPIKYIDPTGHCKEGVDFNNGIGAAIGGAAGLGWIFNINKNTNIEEDIPTLESEYKINQDKITTSPVKVEIVGNDIIIRVYANFKGADETVYPGGSKTYEELAKEGFNKWAGTYNVFGRESNVSVIVVDSDEANLLNYGQKFTNININDETGRSHVSYGFGGWSITNSGKMTVYTRTGEGTNERQRTETEFSNTVAHEFGHMLGLDDAYGEGSRPEADITAEIPSNDIMRSHWGTPVITDNDIEMLVLAWSNNEMQHYRNYSEGFWIFKKHYKQSDAIGK